MEWTESATGEQPAAADDKSLDQERRSVREQASLQDRLSESSTTRGSGIEKLRCDDCVRLGRDHGRAIERRAEEQDDMCVK